MRLQPTSHTEDPLLTGHAVPKVVLWSHKHGISGRNTVGAEMSRIEEIEAVRTASQNLWKHLAIHQRARAPREVESVRDLPRSELQHAIASLTIISCHPLLLSD